MAKKYIVDLSEDEVSQLQTLIKKGKQGKKHNPRSHSTYGIRRGNRSSDRLSALSPYFNCRANKRKICNWWDRFCTS